MKILSVFFNQGSPHSNFTNVDLKTQTCFTFESSKSALRFEVSEVPTCEVISHSMDFGCPMSGPCRPYKSRI